VVRQAGEADVSATIDRQALDIQATVARIDRDLTESRRAREEAFKLMDERKMFEAQTKKLDIEIRWYPLVAFGGAAGIIGGLIGAILTHFLK
jgi:hypothetical protein